jgi:hypothetical protein
VCFDEVVDDEPLRVVGGCDETETDFELHAVPSGGHAKL